MNACKPAWRGKEHGKMKILIVAEHASSEFGGEAALPLHYFRVLRRRGHDVWLLVHERTRAELVRQFGEEPRIVFLPDTPAIRMLWHLGSRLPARIANISTGYLMRILTQRRQARMAKALVRQSGIEVVHQPMPVSPREPSLLYALGAPVVIGPMNGGMDYPPSFKGRAGRLEAITVNAARRLSTALNWLMPGKRRASVLLVANERTRRALPGGLRSKILELVENGVDLSVWHGPAEQPGHSHVRFVFVGRLVDWKAVDLLLAAFANARTQQRMSLLVIGDGPERGRLEARARELGVLSAVEDDGTVVFAGWRSQDDCAQALAARDALVLPSLYECGGAVVLEAMAMQRAVIATDWGGPQDYLDPSCGVLVSPASRELFIAGLEDAMLQLAADPALRRAMGEAGAKKVKRTFDWEVKADRIVEAYRDALDAYAAPRRKPA
jgi:glycosyltransferase involved in cell wall biosynthesis